MRDISVRHKSNISYSDDVSICKCSRLLNSGLKKYNPMLYTEVIKYLKSMKSETGIREHSFELSDYDKNILGDLTIKHLGGVIYSFSCDEVLNEYTMVEPVVYKGKFIPGTKSDLTKKIKFKIDFLDMLSNR